MQMLTTTVARILFAIPFLVFGLLHFVGANDMAGMVPVPGGVFWVYLTGAAMVAGGLAIVTGRMASLACLLLAVLLLTYILTIHIPGAMSTDAATQQMSMMSVLKDMGLMGAALSFAGIFKSQGK